MKKFIAVIMMLTMVTTMFAGCAKPEAAPEEEAATSFSWQAAQTLFF